MSIKKSFLRLCLACALILGCSISCMAAPSDCKLTVKLYDENKKPIDGMNVFICKVADINGTDYVPTEAFMDSGISVSGLVKNPSADTANAVYQYVKKHHVKGVSAQSQNGEVDFESLNRAIWLVYSQEEQEYTFNPYFVFLPQTINGKVQYEVVAEPKVEQNVNRPEPVIPDTNQTDEKLPPTGDNASPWLSFVFLVLSGVGILGVSIMEHKKVVRKNK